MASIDAAAHEKLKGALPATPLPAIVTLKEVSVSGQSKLHDAPDAKFMKKAIPSMSVFNALPADLEEEHRGLVLLKSNLSRCDFLWHEAGGTT